jgi:integrase
MSHGIYSRRFRHGVTWYIRFTVHGREVKERVGREADGITRRLATDALKARLGDIARGRFRLPEARRPVLVREVVARYRAYAETHHRGYRSTRYVLAQLDAAFGRLPVTDLSAFRIEGWKAARRKVVEPATVNRELTVLKAMLAKAVAWHLLDIHPARDVKPFPVNNTRVRWLPADDLARLLAAAVGDVAAAWLVPAIIIAVHTGLRQAELLRLRWADLGPGRTIATIRRTKNNEPKHVPLNATVQATLAALPVVGATVLAWPWGDPVSDTTLYAAFRRACRAAGITDFHWHDLRHTFASHLVMAGVDLRTVQEFARSQDAGDDPALQPPGPRAQGDGRRAAHRGASRPSRSSSPPPLSPEDRRRRLPRRIRNVSGTPPSGRQTPAKRKYMEGRRLAEWTRSQPIRTAGEIPLRVPLLRTATPFAYQRVAARAVTLHRLGMSGLAIARYVGVSDKTVAKALRWARSDT